MFTNFCANTVWTKNKVLSDGDFVAPEAEEAANASWPAIDRDRLENSITFEGFTDPTFPGQDTASLEDGHTGMA